MSLADLVGKDVHVTGSPSGSSTRTSKFIKAPREALYRDLYRSCRFTVWLPPGEITGRIHAFDARVGGGYQMLLFYPASEQVHRRKTSEREDRVTARFVQLEPPKRIVEAVSFTRPVLPSQER